MKRSRLQQIGKVILLLSLVWVGLIGSAAAQEGGSIRLRKVDTSQFPTVQVLMTVSDANGQRVEGLDASNFTVSEDGLAVSDIEISEVDAGLQILVIIDASQSILKPGATGETRLQEARAAIDELVFTERWIDTEGRSDWVAVVVPHKDQIEMLVPWTNDYTLVHNEVYLYQPPPDQGVTQLFQIVSKALDLMSDETVPEGLHQCVIVFSDSAGKVKKKEADDLISRINALGLPIYVVQLGPMENPRDKLMVRLALETGGSYHRYKSLNVLQEKPFRYITSHHRQYVLSYRSQIAEAGEHKLSVEVKHEAATGQAESTFSIDIKPPQVKIVKPAPEAIIEPEESTIQIAWSWPDGHPRQIVRAEYSVDGVAFPIAAPFESVTWDPSSFSAGPHSLRATVWDELGLKAESEAVPIQISAPPEKPSEAGEAGGVQLGSVLLWVVVALGLAASGFFIYRMVLRRQALPVPAARQPKLTHTTPWRPAAGEPAPPTIRGRAYLVVEKGDRPNRPPIDLVSENTRLGRDGRLVNVVFKDDTVSRLHARITEEEDGKFRIYDEGSTSGTFVNYVEVPIEGQWLEHDDLINLGRIQLRFKLRHIEEPPTPAPPAAEVEEQIETEAYEPGVTEPELGEIEHFETEAYVPEIEKPGEVEHFETEPYIPDEPESE